MGKGLREKGENAGLHAAVHGFPAMRQFDIKKTDKRLT
jgi:hypothetical protein